MNSSEQPFVPEKEIKSPKKIEYRSPGLEHGALNRIGVPHMHIDGARDPRVVYDVVKELEGKGDLGKFNYVFQSIGGRQRQELPEIYESHTPAIDGQEALDFFSSSIVQDRKDAIAAVNLAAEKVKNISGAIIELEQVVGWYDSRGWKKIEAEREIQPILPEEIDFKPMPTWPYEVHHGFNVSKDSEVPPVDLKKLLEDCENAGIVIGGWFVFEKDKEWAYRSNSFSKSESVHAVVEKEQQALNKILDSYIKGSQARTLVERVLGIWHSGEQTL